MNTNKDNAANGRLAPVSGSACNTDTIRTIPPAETFIINKMKTYPSGVPPTPKDVEEWMIEFAKMHVAATLKAAEDSIYLNACCNICCHGDEIVFKDNPISNCYPLYNVE